MGMNRISRERSYVSGRELARRGPLNLTADQVQGYAQLENIGIGVGGLVASMDSALIGPGIGQIDTPVQFLQTWLPGTVRQITTVRVIDELIGVATVGQWDDEEIVQTFNQLTGRAVLYGDTSNVPLSNYTPSYVRRTVVRFEQGMSVSRLEEKRAARAEFAVAVEKRAAAALALDIIRNRVGFNGFNIANSRTYGFLSDPNLPAYTNVAAGVGGMSWGLKTFNEIIANITTAVLDIVTSSGGNIRPATTPLTLTLPLGYEQYLGVVAVYGSTSVQDWITKTYPTMRVVTAPELLGANGGANVMYIYADQVENAGTDDGRVMTQMVPSRFEALGTEVRAKNYIEDYTNALAGVLVKRPWAIRRYSGL